ncbi:MAG TPA: hypothetical protein VLA71_01410 [Algoriphagus sp.]|nr:hypothetical protein [Algoriphagus sp.]
MKVKESEIQKYEALKQRINGKDYLKVGQIHKTQLVNELISNNPILTKLEKSGTGTFPSFRNFQEMSFLLLQVLR